MSKGEETQTRRDFLRFCGRAALLGAVALGAGRLLGRRQVSLAGQTCANQGICAGCGKRAVCGLPQALSRRRALEDRS